jgi:hypothetical protein
MLVYLSLSYLHTRHNPEAPLPNSAKQGGEIADVSPILSILRQPLKGEVIV